MLSAHTDTRDVRASSKCAEGFGPIACMTLPKNKTSHLAIKQPLTAKERGDLRNIDPKNSARMASKCDWEWEGGLSKSCYRLIVSYVGPY